MIPEGDRPTLEEVDLDQAPGLEDLFELTKRCWDQEPEERPSFPGEKATMQEPSLYSIEPRFSNFFVPRPHFILEIFWRPHTLCTAQFRHINKEFQNKSTAHVIELDLGYLFEN